MYCSTLFPRPYDSTTQPCFRLPPSPSPFPHKHTVPPPVDLLSARPHPPSPAGMRRLSCRSTCVGGPWPRWCAACPWTTYSPCWQQHCWRGRYTHVCMRVGGWVGLWVCGGLWVCHLILLLPSSRSAAAINSHCYCHHLALLLPGGFFLPRWPHMQRAGVGPAAFAATLQVRL